jgi:hypothetical protein
MAKTDSSPQRKNASAIRESPALESRDKLGFVESILIFLPSHISRSSDADPG